MQDVSALYQGIISAGGYRFETKVMIAELITVGEDKLVSVHTRRSLFSGSSPDVGACVSGEIDLVIRNLNSNIPRMAKLEPFVRACNASQQSEWLPKGKFWIDTRETSPNGVVRIHGYDAMLKAEADFPISAIQEWPSTDADVVQAIADQIDVSVDDRTWAVITNAYTVQLPTGYTSREVLGYVAAMYAGCFIMNDEGMLQLITLNAMPEETNHLVDDSGNAITFGGTRILV